MVESRREFNLSPIGHFVYLSGTGHIYCQSCTAEPIWCDHQQQVMIQDVDQIVIWDRSPDSMPCAIPMFPTQDLWTWVNLNSAQKKFPLYLVHWKHPLNDDSKPLSRVGYLHPGEGRNVIRNMLIQHMYSGPQDFKCKSTVHGYTQEMMVQQRTKSGLLAAEQWSVFTTDQCIACNIGVTPPDDLVPEDNKSGSGTF